MSGQWHLIPARVPALLDSYRQILVSQMLLPLTNEIASRKLDQVDSVFESAIFSSFSPPMRNPIPGANKIAVAR